jgi:SAM-dependent methyltransferase
MQTPPTDARLHYPAADRNKQPLLQQLQRLLPPQGIALEIASGTGQHIAWFAQGLPEWTWLSSDRQEDFRASIAAWTQGLANVRPPLALDVLESWPELPPLDAVYCANMLHIAPWPTCEGLMRGAARVLKPEGLLLTYGPYQQADVATAPGNVAFDADLRARNPAWGLRSVEALAEVAREVGLRLRERVGMPANNLLLVFGRAGG